MADERITVLARLKAKEGMEEEVRQQCLLLIEPTRREKGCITYDFHQNGDDPSQFMFCEKWRSKEDLDNHIGQLHLQRFISMADEMLDGALDVSIWKKLS